MSDLDETVKDFLERASELTDAELFKHLAYLQLTRVATSNTPEATADALVHFSTLTIASIISCPNTPDELEENLQTVVDVLTTETIKGYKKFRDNRG